MNLLKSPEDGVKLEPLIIPEGHVRVVQCNEETGVIMPVLPHACGISGGIEQLTESVLFVLTNDGTQLHTSMQSNGKERRDLPVIEVESLSGYDIRLSVTGVDGPLQSFVNVRGQEPITDTVAPVSDMFAGKISLVAGMYSVTTEVYNAPKGPKISGSMSLRTEDDRLCVTATMPGGSELNLLLDTGGGSSLVLAKDALPEGADLATG